METETDREGLTSTQYIERSKVHSSRIFSLLGSVHTLPLPVPSTSSSRVEQEQEQRTFPAGAMSNFSRDTTHRWAAD